MKKGKYTHYETTYHSNFGKLEPNRIYELPDDWDFEKETLFEKIDDGVVKVEEKARPKNR
jgi:hypothetical protein